MMQRRSATTLFTTIAGSVALSVIPEPASASSHIMPTETQPTPDIPGLLAEISNNLASKGQSIEGVLRSYGYESAAAEYEEGAPHTTSRLDAPNATSSARTRKALRVAVAGIGASFLSAGYKLSAELALHGLNLKRGGTTRIPKNGGIAAQTQLVKRLRSSKSRRGSAAFEKTGGTVGYDLYYSIHRFSWVRVGTRINIRDVYDFSANDYAGLQQKVIKVMLAAQQTRAIYPFNVRITV